jgi:hypothetical protein
MVILLSFRSPEALWRNDVAAVGRFSRIPINPLNALTHRYDPRTKGSLPRELKESKISRFSRLEGRWYGKAKSYQYGCSIAFEPTQTG